MIRQLSKLILLGIACSASMMIQAQDQTQKEQQNFKQTDSTSLTGMWRGEMRGKGDIIGKAYIGPSSTSHNVFHVWDGPLNNRHHCRYPLERMGEQADKSVVYKEKSTGNSSCKPQVVKFKRVGAKFIEATRFDPDTKAELWKGNLKRKWKKKPAQQQDSSLIRWLTHPIDQITDHLDKDSQAEHFIKKAEEKGIKL